MRALRGTEVPIEHLAAELAATPLASDAAMRLSTIEIHPEMKGPSDQLWRAAEYALLQNCSSFGVEEITALRDWLWFAGRSKDPTSMVDFVRTISNAVLVFSGNVFRPRMPPWALEVAHTPSGSSDARARRFWRWVSFALPPDLLMALHPADGAVSSEVELLSPILSSILRDRGYVEPHMHLGAAIDFSLLWISTLHAIGDPDMTAEYAFKSPGADMDEGRLFAGWLVRSAIARYVLASFLAHRRAEQIETSTTLDDYMAYRVFPLFSLPTPPEKEEEVKPDKDSSTKGRKEASMVDRHRRGYVDPEASMADGRRGVYVDPGRGAGLRLCLHEMATGGFIAHTPFTQLQRLYAQLTSLRGRWFRFPHTLEEARWADPIGSMFPPRGPGQRTSEMEYVAAAAVYLQTEHGKKDFSFRHLFWQSQRVRVRYYRHVVQRPMTPGLQWFTRFYARLSPGRRPLGVRALVTSAAQICGMGFGLRSLEFRLTPAADQSSMRSMLVEVGQALQDMELVSTESAGSGREPYSQDALPLDGITRALKNLKHKDQHNIRMLPSDGVRPEVGLVFHFSRERGGGTAEGTPIAHGRSSAADPSWPRNLGYRYSWYYKQKRREAMTIAGLLRRFPQLLAIVRGIDVCTDELGIPNWVIAPLLRYVKEVAGAASSFAQSSLRRSLPPLRTTAHAGEDFVHLLGGLRRIEESIDYFQLGQGDRLGHAIALGINPSEWALRVGGVAMTQIERLFDLAWEWSFCTERALNLPASRIQYIIDKIERLSKSIFNEYAHPPQVANFMDLLRDERELRVAQFPHGPLGEEREYLERRRRAESGGTRERDKGGSFQDGQPLEKGDQGEAPWRLLYAYLTDPKAFINGQKQVLVDPSFEAESLEIIQTELRRKIGAAGITVEINPSSNLLIGNMSDLQNHPLWRLKSPEKQAGVPVAVCIGSDDPITFATRNREEYQLVYDTLTLAGLSDMEARQWLQEVREAGLESRFTLPLPQEWDWTPTDVDILHVRDLL